MVTRRYLVSGRVQGVGFRWFTRTAALRHGIVGWVRNLADGRVEVEATAAEDVLLLFEHDLLSGPAHGRVDDVSIQPLSSTATMTSFEVRADG